MDSTSVTMDFPRENRIIFDWLSFTTKIHDVVDLVHLLGLAGCPFEVVNGSKGFRYRQYFGGISIHFNDKEYEGNLGRYIWLEMSGQGCRTFETYGNGDYDVLFNLARRDPENCHIKRIDVAFDDMEKLFDIDVICDMVRQEHFISRLKQYQAIYSNCGNAVYFGSQRSNVYIRIYDKAKERGFKDGLHWIRCELQLRDRNADGFVRQLLNHPLQELYLGVIKNYLSFKLPSEDSNKRRWPEPEWWVKFLNHAVAISVFEKPGVIYNLSACEKYVMTQPVGSIRALIKIYGAAAFVAMIMRAPAPKNPKYQQLVHECKQMQTDDSVIEALEKRASDIEFLREMKESYLDIDRAAREKSLFISRRRQEDLEFFERQRSLRRLYERGILSEKPE